MSALKHPAQQQALNLTDPDNVTEWLANSLIGVRIAEAHCFLTFDIVQPKHPEPGAPEVEHVAPVRLVLPFQVLESMAVAVSNLKSAMALNTVIGSQVPVS